MRNPRLKPAQPTPSRRDRSRSNTITIAPPTTLPEIWPRLLLPALIILAGILAYANSIHGAFIFDDRPNIEEKPLIRDLWAIGDFLRSPRPLLFFSLALNYAVGKLDPRGYHIVNIAIHILAALTLYGLIRRTLLLPTFQQSTRVAASSWLAGVITLIWVVHPLTTQAVTYVVQRGESMMALFYLLTLYCYVRGATAVNMRAPWFVAAALACLAGLMSKEVMVTAPAAVLLYDYILLSGKRLRALRSRWRPLVCLFLVAVSYLAWKGRFTSILAPDPNQVSTVGFANRAVTWSQYARSQPGVIVHYLALSIKPWPLCLDYAWPVANTPKAILLPWLILAPLLAAIVIAWRRSPALGFLGLAFFIILAPTSSFIPIEDLAFEHRMYLPLACVIAAIVLGGWHLSRRLNRDGAVEPIVRQALTAGVVLCVVAALTWGTIRRNRDYRDPIEMWRRVLDVSPKNAGAHVNLGILLANAGRPDQAMQHYHRALDIQPNFSLAAVNLATCLASKGRHEEAVKYCRAAIQANPRHAEAYANLGNSLAVLGQIPKAVQAWRDALARNDRLPTIHNNLGMIRSKQGQEEAGKRPKRSLEYQTEALTHFDAALNIEPDYLDAQKNRAYSLVTLKRPHDAIAAYRLILQQTPADPISHCNLAMLLAGQGDATAAADHFRATLRLDPNNATAKQGLARLQSQP